MAAKFSSAAAARGVTASRSEPGAASRQLRSADFDGVYREGSRRGATHFVVLARPNGLGRARFGISVKTALGGAVVRNRIKRRVRALLRHVPNPALRGWDIVVQPRSNAVAGADFSRLAEELTCLLASVT